MGLQFLLRDRKLLWGNKRAQEPKNLIFVIAL